MCGIVGLLLKRDDLHRRLGEFVAPMIDCMGTRGPDSAGLAVFHEPLDATHRRFGLHSRDLRFDWQTFHEAFQSETGSNGSITVIENHAAVISAIDVENFKVWLRQSQPGVHLLSVGRAIDVYKDEGHPRDISRRLHRSRL